ncbi:MULTISPECIES: aromatic ring-hydroxylating oxygenase subunit alpha [unclassified Sphingomonas]|uniref:aromatic ring-hydroxylating oxygenase subunit alpha n=1 Tax=unclassified Sphingomonas TaxID=196159 RepID=UPI00215132FF|nr:MULTISPECIES: aromatic ring-hydroxylating dioxygenase subunit alpha [unclassified Sphingomonas]MCR5869475.1 aromatic ring-hydroxylating dioxygenase subunit alpha [Sphingomonas sp. J344]UUY01473.1 aromatic ring-hydroxylating dioxygenase subunit alpha [Sphingomonas sp. J315]
MAHRFADVSGADPDDNLSLPGWLYTDPEYFEVEVDRVLRPSWQIVCHVSDIANAGDYHTLDYLGESVIAIRGQDGVVRAFANVCRHRAMRLVDGPSGCTKKLVCPYHAWSYEVDGRLTGVPMRGDYSTLVLEDNGLAPVEVEIWQGFVFVRLTDRGGPSVAEMMSPYDTEIAPYRFEDMRTISPERLRDRDVNWKNVGDNYSDGLHIPVAHVGLTRLFGKSYAIEAQPWVDKMSGYLADSPRSNFWEAMYQKHLPRVDHLPDTHQRLWLYYKLWPNQAFDVYPDQIDFMQWLPTGPTSCVLREMAFALPGADRTMKLVRYANWRINRVVNAEDTWLITNVQRGMASRSYTVGPIGDSEVCLRSFARKIRGLIPEARLHRAPAPGWSRRPPNIE